MKKSEIISDFLKLLADSANSLAHSRQELKRYEGEKQDILHEIELDNINYKERAKRSTQLKTVLKNRRAEKDIIEITEPITAFAEISANKNTIRALQCLLGEVRKIESYHSNRTYRKRSAQ